MKRITTTILIGVLIALLPCSLLIGCGGGNEQSASSGGVKANPNAFALAKGKVVYNSTCITCHGEGGKGIEGLGKDWTTSEFIRSKTDQELLEFIKVGRPLDDPLSNGIAIMPPRGGNQTLNDQDLRNVIVYMRSLQE